MEYVKGSWLTRASESAPEESRVTLGGHGAPGTGPLVSTWPLVAVRQLVAVQLLGRGATIVGCMLLLDG